jgi:CelD/BcsL family acetyltransferase involved in cellulose biosynthesis
MAQTTMLDTMPVAGAGARPGVVPSAAAEITVTVTNRLAEVEEAWRALSATIESPGQSLPFIRAWIDAFRIPESEQVFVLAREGEKPLAFLPLHRQRRLGLRTLGWFPGSHVGCGAPLVDRERLTALGSVRRRRLWLDMLRSLPEADLVHLRSVPELKAGDIDLFAELGQSMPGDTLYRAHFSSFDEADRTQRTKSRRKHDRQQGEKLEAMGQVTFEDVGNGDAALAVLEVMFRQRAARFREMGVPDPFAAPATRAFYDSTARAGSGVDIRLHVLRLDGEIVATRYNVVHGDRLFCLISSMSEDAVLRPGSPGKQCLLRVMQTVFDAGYRTFDMGEGLTDEKRHWCNEQIPVSHRHIPVTRRGALIMAAERAAFALRHRVKNDPRLLAMAKRLRGLAVRSKAGSAEAAGD